MRSTRGNAGVADPSRSARVQQALAHTSRAPSSVTSARTSPQSVVPTVTRRVCSRAVTRTVKTAPRPSAVAAVKSSASIRSPASRVYVSSETDSDDDSQTIRSRIPVRWAEQFRRSIGVSPSGPNANPDAVAVGVSPVESRPAVQYPRRRGHKCVPRVVTTPLLKTNPLRRRRPNDGIFHRRERSRR